MVAPLGTVTEGNLRPTIWTVDPSAPNSMSLEVRVTLPLETASSASLLDALTCEVITWETTGVGVGDGRGVGVGIGPSGVGVGEGVVGVRLLSYLPRSGAIPV